MKTGRSWTRNEVEKLSILWNDKQLSAGEIGRLLGRERDSVLGHIFRLRAKGMFFAKRDTSPAASALTAETRARRQHRKLPTLPVAVIDSPPPPPEGKRLLELKMHECRWPLGQFLTPATTFCAAAIVDITSSSYCNKHQLISRRSSAYP